VHDVRVFSERFIVLSRHELEPKQAELVKLRFFVGLKIEEAAEVLGISQATAKRWWVYAKAWLFQDLQTPRE
jgi:DNA-directed RNA polymerase specialized sigma24 family protein